MFFTKGAGFSTGSGVGRIGLATFNDEVVYALLDNQFIRPSIKKGKKLRDHFGYS